MKRRVQVADGVSGVPPELLRFSAADWRDPDYVPPRHMSEQDVRMMRGIRAFKRFLAARRVFEADTGVHIRRSWERDEVTGSE